MSLRVKEAKCEVCGQKATVSVKDQQELPQLDGYRRWTTHSSHWFCMDHAREPIRYGLEGERG